MEKIDCFFIGHYSLPIKQQVQLSIASFGKESYYYQDALEKRFIRHNNKMYTVSQLYNLLYQSNSSYSYDHTTFERNFSCAIAQLGTKVNRAGLTFDYINSFNEGKDYLKESLQNKKINCIAVTTTFYISAFPIYQIVNFIKKYNKNVKIIIGGPYIRNVVESLNKEALEKLFHSINGDIYVYNHEGDEALVNTVNALKNNIPLNSIKNIYYKNNDSYSFTVFEKEENPLIQHLCDWNLFQDRLTPYVNIRTSISCPFSCFFCGLPGVGGKYRQLSIDEIETELNKLHALPNRPSLFFIDETFNYTPERFKEILKMMVKNKYEFKWESEFRCQYADREMVELMKKTGCQMVYCGIESGNQDVLNNMDKQVEVEQYYNGIKLLNEFNIFSVALLIIGFPGETYETFQDTVKFLEEAKPTFYRVHRWYYDLKTPIHQYKEKYKISGEGYNWKHYTMDSETANALANKIVLEIKKSIHTADYPIAFDLISRGYSKTSVKKFLQYFDAAVREKIRDNNNPEIREELIESMKNVLEYSKLKNEVRI